MIRTSKFSITRKSKKKPQYHLMFNQQLQINHSNILEYFSSYHNLRMVTKYFPTTLQPVIKMTQIVLLRLGKKFMKAKIIRQSNYVN